jgi:CrcB protein
MIVALVVLGGGFGAVSRWLATVWLGTNSKGFPVGTTAVNVSGSFVLGVLVGLDISVASNLRDPLTIGLLGGFTTFSTWMVEIDRAQPTRNRILVGIAPMIAGLAAAAVGLFIGGLIGSR